jgi:hypothetical protein
MGPDPRSPDSLSRAELLEELADHLREHLLYGSHGVAALEQVRALRETLDAARRDSRHPVRREFRRQLAERRHIAEVFRPKRYERRGQPRGVLPTRQRGPTRERRPTARRTVRTTAASRDGPGSRSDDDPPDPPGSPDVVLEVAVGGRGPEALLEGLRRLGLRPGLTRVSVEHDNGCGAIAASMAACTCELVRLVVRRAA